VAELSAGERLVAEGRDRWHSMRLAACQRACEGLDLLALAVRPAGEEHRNEGSLAAILPQKQAGHGGRARRGRTAGLRRTGPVAFNAARSPDAAGK
jgi:hypothetical protein